MMSLLLLFSGCVINGNQSPRPADLSEAWLVDRTRILAVRAEPPEIRPGEATVMASLIAGPLDADLDLSLVWLACEDGDSFGCATDLSALDFEALDLAAAQAAGLIGFEPGFEPRYVAPTDLLDDLDDVERLEGRNVQTQLFAFPTETLTSGELDDLDFNEIEVGFKRVVVSEATTPNNNPRIDALTIEGTVVPEAVEAVEVTAGQQYELGVVLTEPRGIEQYQFVNSEGVVEDRVEEPYVAWFATGGEVTEPVTLYPFLEMTWTAPDEPGLVRVYGVLRDRRGGMAWVVQDLLVR